MTQEIAKQIFDYKDGFLYWKIRSSNRIRIGDKVGSITQKDRSPRYVFGYQNKDYLCARIIFLWHKGYLPKEVDHKDRNGLNDNIENLREADRSQNGSNTRSRKNTTSKYLGVHYFPRDNNWRTQITHNRKCKHIGYFPTEEAAAIAYNEKAKILHGEFANLNIININN